RITRSDAFIGDGIPENLRSKIELDGIPFNSQYSYDSLGEFDYTMGSGWMYCINGQLFPGRGLSEYYLNDGDNISIRFTLAYGKDIGGSSSTGGDYGRLSSYCGMWVNGGF